MVSFEPDFMNQNYNCVDDFVETVDQAELWQHGMADAAAARRLPRAPAVRDAALPLRVHLQVRAAVDARRPVLRGPVGHRAGRRRRADLCAGIKAFGQVDLDFAESLTR